MKPILTTILIFLAKVSFTQTIDLDTLLSARSDNFIVKYLSSRYPIYQLEKDNYKWKEFSLQIDQRHQSCKLTIRPSNIFALNNHILNDSIDIAFCHNIDNSHYKPESIHIVPNGTGYKLIYEYKLHNLSTVRLFFEHPNKEVSNPIVDFSTNYHFYRYAKLSRVEVHSISYPPDIREDEVPIINKVAFADSIYKAGDKKRALFLYKKIARKHKNRLSEYTDVHYKIYAIASELSLYDDQISSLKHVVKNNYNNQGTFYLTKICRVYLYAGKYRQLYRTSVRILNSENADCKQRMLSLLHLHIAQILSKRDDKTTREQILDAATNYNVKLYKSNFDDLKNWLNKLDSDKEIKHYITSLIDEISIR